jgi:NADPH:quinone reductase-like Zn-dependent oxidoreductase
MRAIVVEDYGAAPTLRDLPAPVPGEGEVRVRVHASSLNGIDRLVAAGDLRGRMEHRFPVVLGKDFAGVVDLVGPGVRGLTPGQRVFGVVMKPVLHDGAFGDHVTVPADFAIARMPDRLAFAEAGALGFAGATAVAALEAVDVRAGDSLLVAGATGGVGTFVVQLAAARGVRVAATARSPAGAELVSGLGATPLLDRAGDFTALARAVAPGGFDAVIHLAGDAPTLAELLVPHGRLATTHELGRGRGALGGRPVTAVAIVPQPTAAVLAGLAEAVAAGRLTVPIQRTYPLARVPQALHDYGTGIRGKLAVAVSA